MALATTSSIWRSTGGDTTRTASAGSMEMVLPFYIANVAATSNVSVSSALVNNAVILPAGATVTSISINATGTGNIDLGFTPLSGVGAGQTTVLGTNVPQAFLANASTATRVSVGVSTESFLRSFSCVISSFSCAITPSVTVRLLISSA